MASLMAHSPSSWQHLLTRSATDFLLAAVALLVVRNIVTRTLRWHRLRHIPGPYRTEEFFEKYGPIVRIGPNEILCFEPDKIRRITLLKAGYTKDKRYKVGQINPPEENTMTAIDLDARKQTKMMVLPAYAGKGTADFESCIDTGLAKWLESIEQRYAGKDVDMDLGRQVHVAVFDTVGEIAYGRPLEFVENNADQGNFLKISEAMLPILITISNYSPYLLSRVGDDVRLGAVMRHSFSQAIIDERLKPGAKQNKDMLQIFLNHGLSRAQLLAEVSLQFFAGSDTTANTITLTLFHLLTNAGKYQRLREELDAATGHDPNAIIPDSVAKNLPSLQACIREALRIQTPLASGSFHKAVPVGGDTVSGKYLPHGGTRIPTNGAVHAIGRAKAYWGADAKQFRPERWLEADAETKQRVLAMVDLTWSAGAFLCPGKVTGVMEAGKAVAECVCVVRRFDISLANPDDPAHFHSAIAWTIHDFWVRVEKRKDGTEKTHS
ncbi:cytochrome P450 [Lasiosphaeria ovina]|uniref:Cytochrome P450 n=1 Tax=Lasiosphaeria ovina TaxID=92902 RepID=A0AAE0JYH5_9PEZI|nr:cytochrome P450 [Lasiosphaeria ovina]